MRTPAGMLGDSRRNASDDVRVIGINTHVNLRLYVMTVGQQRSHCNGSSHQAAIILTYLRTLRWAVVQVDSTDAVRLYCPNNIVLGLRRWSCSARDRD